MSVRIYAAAAALAGMAAAPAAAQSGWLAAGRVKIDAEASAATMEVRWGPKFDEVMLCTEGSAVKLNSATFRYKDGKTKIVKLRARLADGACTKTTSLGRGRDVASVDIAYDPASLQGAKTKIQLVAR